VSVGLRADEKSPGAVWAARVALAASRAVRGKRDSASVEAGMRRSTAMQAPAGESGRYNMNIEGVIGNALTCLQSLVDSIRSSGPPASVP